MKLGDLAVGKAGEYLVCSDLIQHGHIAFPSEQGIPYDIIADIKGKLLRVQVKTTQKTKQPSNRKVHMPSYVFHVKRCGNGGKRTYRYRDIDIFALVGLDSKAIAYLTPRQTKTTMLFRNPLLRGKYRNEICSERRDAIRADKNSGMKNSDISRKYELDPSVVGRMLSHSSEVYQFGCPYLDAFRLEDCLKLIAANDNEKKAKAA